MGKPTLADLSAELETIHARLAALEIRVEDIEATAQPLDVDEFDDALSDEERAAVEAAEMDERAAIGAALALIEVEIHGDLDPLLARLGAQHGLHSDIDMGDGWVKVAMYDIEALGRGDIRLALRNWCNAARRLLPQAA